MTLNVFHFRSPYTIYVLIEVNDFVSAVLINAGASLTADHKFLKVCKYIRVWSERLIGLIKSLIYSLSIGDSSLFHLHLFYFAFATSISFQDEINVA